MATIDSIKITSDHLSSPLTSGYNFSEDFEGTIVCPISLEELKEGETCYKVNCCKAIISRNSLRKALLTTTEQCVLCKQNLNFDSLLDETEQEMKKERIKAKNENQLLKSQHQMLILQLGTLHDPLSRNLISQQLLLIEKQIQDNNLHIKLVECEMFTTHKSDMRKATSDLSSFTTNFHLDFKKMSERSMREQRLREEKLLPEKIKNLDKMIRERKKHKDEAVVSAAKPASSRKTPSKPSDIEKRMALALVGKL